MKHEISILRQYANENGIPIRSTSDLSPLEIWLVNEIIKERTWYSAQICDLKTNKK